MSTKHNVNHHEAFGRGPGNYRARLQARGLSKAPALAPLDKLRARQAARVEATGQPWPTEFRYAPEQHVMFFVTDDGVPLARKRTKAEMSKAA